MRYNRYSSEEVIIMAVSKRGRSRASKAITRDSSIEAPPDMVDEPSAETDAPIQPQAEFPIVGIGASAGGLTAFEAFF